MINEKTMRKQFVCLTVLLMMAGCGFDERAGKPAEEQGFQYVPVAMLSAFDDVELTIYDTTVTQAEIDDGTSNVVFNGIIDNDDEDLEIELDASKVSDSKYLLFEVKAKDATNGTYFDPIKKTRLPLGTQVIHHFVKSDFSEEDDIFRVDPYAEIAYQRTLVLSGLVDATERREISEWSGITEDMIKQAQSEVELTLLGGNSSQSWFSPVNDVESLWVHPSSVAWYKYNDGDESERRYGQWVIALAHIQAFATKYTTSNFPLLDFTKSASLDMLDGDFDGRTIWVGGKTTFAQPSLDPALENLTLPGDRKIQFGTRDTYVSLLGRAAKKLFEDYKNATRCNNLTLPLPKAESQRNGDWLLEGSAGVGAAYCEVKITYNIEGSAEPQTKTKRLDGKGSFSVEIDDVAPPTNGAQWRSTNFSLQTPRIEETVEIFVGLKLKDTNVDTLLDNNIAPMFFNYTEGRTYLPAAGAGNYTNPFGIYDRLRITANPTFVINSNNTVTINGTISQAELIQFGRLSIELNYTPKDSNSVALEPKTLTKDVDLPATGQSDTDATDGFTFSANSGLFVYTTSVLANLASDSVNSIKVEGERRSFLIQLLGTEIQGGLFGNLSTSTSQSNRLVLDYFIGTHTLGDCTVTIKPTGDVTTKYGTTTVTRNLGADLIDSLFRREGDSNTRYRLNLGDSTISPAEYTILDINTAENDYEITKVTLGKVKQADNTTPDSTAADLSDIKTCQ